MVVGREGGEQTEQLRSNRLANNSNGHDASTLSSEVERDDQLRLMIEIQKTQHITTDPILHLGQMRFGICDSPGPFSYE